MLIKYVQRDSPGGSVNKNLPSKTGDMGSISSLGRSHVLQSMCPCAATTEACALEPVLGNKRVVLTHSSKRKPTCSNEDPEQPQINKWGKNMCRTEPSSCLDFLRT